MSVCILCGHRGHMRMIVNYAGVSGATAIVCVNPIDCAKRQVEAEGRVAARPSNAAQAPPKSPQTDKEKESCNSE